MIMEPNPAYKEVYMIAMYDYSEDGGSLIYYQTAYSTLELAEQKLDEMINKFDSEVFIDFFEEVMIGIDELYPTYHIRYTPYEEMEFDDHANSYRSYTITRIYVDKDPNEEKVA